MQQPARIRRSAVLGRGAFERMAAESPELESKLVRNLLASTSRILDRLSFEALLGSAG